ncbi:MAG: glycoside hydrolase family 13 protein [Lachnospiraceae bacterium]|nr:glycoside hydrolase family 13 protein [Lachnospiraceae bacterium]
MNREALFSDGTKNYVMPPEPKKNEMVTISFRTAKDDVDAVFLRSEAENYPMVKEKSTVYFDFFKTTVPLKEKAFQYFFEVRKDDEIIYYTQGGPKETIETEYKFMIMPGFSTPDWAKGAVMYQIYVDRFYNGDPLNDVQTGEYIYIGQRCSKVEDWYQYPKTEDVREFYGGDLQGVIDKLDYLEELGVEVVYFNPLFVSPSNHKYDTQDYDYIDPHIGVIVEDGGEVLPEGAASNLHAEKYRIRTTRKANLEASNELFIQMVEKMHERGMRVIIDGVFNHCGSFNKWMDREHFYKNENGYEKGAYVDRHSPYHNFFYFFGEDSENWPDNDNYEGWWGHNTLPKLNYEGSEELENYILDTAAKWVSPPYNADGWRLDVAADLGKTNEYNHSFWQRFRKRVKEANSEAIILAEHYGDPKEWLAGEEWDTVMNYDAFMEPVTWFLTGMEKHSDEYRGDLHGNADNFVNLMRHYMGSMMTPSLFVAMNELSNHDHSRFLTRTNQKVGRINYMSPKEAETGVKECVMREAVVMQMTWPGAPTVYYGDEAGVCGFTDPDNRRTYPWGRENQEMLSFHKEMIGIHKAHEALKTGSIKMLCWEENLLAYARFDASEKIVVIINNSDSLKEIMIPVWKAEVEKQTKMQRLIYSYENGYTKEREEYLVTDGEMVLIMGAFSALVLWQNDEI